MNTLKALAVVLMSIVISYIFACLVTSMQFQHRATGIMTIDSGKQLGLVAGDSVDGAFGPKTMLFAPINTTEGKYYEYRSVWPVFGAMPHKYFGSGFTKIDMVAFCKSHGKQCAFAENNT